MNGFRLNFNKQKVPIKYPNEYTIHEIKSQVVSKDFLKFNYFLPAPCTVRFFPRLRKGILFILSENLIVCF